MRNAKSRGVGDGQTFAPKTVDEYLERVPEPARINLNKVRAAIWALVPPETTEGMSYGIPMSKYRGALVGFGAFAKHCRLFVTNPAVIVRFRDDLKSFPTSKGTIELLVDQPLPTALLTQIVKTRITRNKG